MTAGKQTRTCDFNVKGMLCVVCRKLPAHSTHVSLTSCLTLHVMERSWGCAKTSRRQATKPIYCQDHIVFCNPLQFATVFATCPLLLFRQIPQTQIWKESFPAVETSNFGSQSQALRPMLMALEAAEHRAFKACQVAEEVPCLVIWCCFGSESREL